MTDWPDARLLKEFVRDNSEAAFAVLVERYIGLVYSVALRHTADTQHAQDITQAVFIIFARKAATLPVGTVIPGWLHHAARLTAANLQRAEMRRINREQEAFMQSKLNEPTNDTLWREMSPQLDEAIAGLGAGERDALVLRYFQNKSMAEVGKYLGLAENAAQKRVSRALEKLRAFFLKRGVSLSTIAIAGIISAKSVQAAPIGMALTVSASAVKGATATAPILTLVKGALKIMAWTKVKTAIVAAAVLALAAGTTTVAVIHEHKVEQAEISTWRQPRITADMINSSAPQVRILPTKFKLPVFGAITAGNGKWAGVDMPVRDLVRIAYDWPPARVYFPEGEPRERYDFATTVTNGGEEALQQKIRTTLGFTVRQETRDMDVFILKVRTPGATGLKPYVSGPLHCEYDARGGVRLAGLPISMPPPRPYWGFTRPLEIYLHTPVVDETELPGNYDINLRWAERYDADPDHAAMKEAMLKQLGLELIPANMPIDVLVVEKTK